MPVKIVKTKSKPKKGLINQHDLKRIIQDFENFVEIDSSISRVFKKINVVSIPALLIKHLLEKAQENDKDLDNSAINVKFGITLPDQKDCLKEELDVSNHLTVILVIEKKGIEMDEPGDFVIAPGFKEFSDSDIKDGACCPVIKPGGGS